MGYGKGGKVTPGSMCAFGLGIILVFLAIYPAVAASAEPAPCKVVAFEDSRFVVCGYRRETDELKLAWRGSTGPLGGFDGLAAWLGPDAKRVRFAMNGGMFDPQQAPVGLLVLSGELQHQADTAKGQGNFYLLPNGVFWAEANGSVHVDETGRFLARGILPMWATQSGPLLVRGGVLHPAIAENGSSLAVRNGVGVRDPDEAFFVISSEPVSFGRFARLFRDHLRCPDALYLDGAVSSLWAPNLARRDPASRLGPLIVVSTKRP